MIKELSRDFQTQKLLCQKQGKITGQWPEIKTVKQLFTTTTVTTIYSRQGLLSLSCVISPDSLLHRYQMTTNSGLKATLTCYLEFSKSRLQALSTWILGSRSHKMAFQTPTGVPIFCAVDKSLSNSYCYKNPLHVWPRSQQQVIFDSWLSFRGFIWSSQTYLGKELSFWLS